MSFSRILSPSLRRGVRAFSSGNVASNITPIYTAEATTVGARNGHVRSSDGVVDLELSLPKALGGPGKALSNPEQLFAAGYSACFGGALNAVAAKHKVKLAETTAVKAAVSIGKDGGGNLGLAVTLSVSETGLDKAKLGKIVEGAHEMCPYSRATRGNVEVTLKYE